MSSTKPTAENFRRMESIYGENHEIFTEYDSSIAVNCDNGIFLPWRRENVLNYKGIPFAKPPVDDLRWKAPVYPDPSDKVYEAFYFGKSAIQDPWFSELASCYPQSEDCLYLNVWKVNDDVKKKPVMVFIHGGAYGYGGTSDPIYNGFYFVKDHPDVILVTIAYRVGIMGFIDFSFVPGSKGYEDSPNLGILDQIMALKWIHNNIEAFGGDKDNVTLFGESAGGGSVSILPVVDEAKGLFRRVIGESGSIALTFSRDEMRPFTEKFMNLTGAKTMEDLLKLSTLEIQNVNKVLNEDNNFPLRDGKLIPENLYEAYASGKSAWCDMINGTNKDECRYWISEMGGFNAYAAGIPMLVETQMAAMNAEDKAITRSYLFNAEKLLHDRATEFENDLIFRCPAQKQLQLHAKNGGKAYNYFWTFASANKEFGACHAVELNHVFNNLNETIYTGTNVSPRLAKTVQELWVNFAKTGNPSTDEVEWPEYNEETKKTLVLGESVFVKENLYSRRSALVDKLLKYQFNGCYAHLKLNNPYTYFLIGSLVVFIVLCVTLLMHFNVF